jgi:hypothetical protein
MYSISAISVIQHWHLLFQYWKKFVGINPPTPIWTSGLILILV